MTVTDDGGPTVPAWPEEAFTILGNETRLEILGTLWTAYEPYGADSTRTFSELYEAVEMYGTSNFSYHLDQLVGPFVTETPEGYRINAQGLEVIQSVIAGTLSDSPSFDPEAIDEACPLCDGSVHVTYDGRYFTCICGDCDGIWPRDDGSGFLMRFNVPVAGVVQRSTEELFEAMLVDSFFSIAMFLRNVCPRCGGPIDVDIEVCEDHAIDAGRRCSSCELPHLAEATTICSVCKSAVRGPVRIAMLANPTVTGFYYNHGIEHRFASWATYHRAYEVTEELLSMDPLRLQLAIPAGTDVLELTIDDAMQVIDAERSIA